jgi:cytidylate kinase
VPAAADREYPSGRFGSIAFVRSSHLGTVAEPADEAAGSPRDGALSALASLAPSTYGQGALEVSNMSFSVVCISRTLAAGGEDIGRAVAERLGYRFVDEEIIYKAAQLAQVDPNIVAAAEHKQPFLQRLIDKLAAAQEMVGPVSLATGLPMEFFQPAGSGPRANADDLRVLIRAAIHEVAHVGQAVIVAHAASMALAGKPDVLRVLVTASDSKRAERIAAAQHLTAKDAIGVIAKSDRERSEYFQTFYKIKQEQPTHYDLVINTDVINSAQAVALIACAAGA